MAAASSGSVAAWSTSASWSGWRNVGVVVEGDLAVERDDRAVGGLHQRVDLDQRGVLGDEDLPQRLTAPRRPGRRPRPGTRPRRDDLGGLGVVDADERVDRDLGQRLRAARPRAARSPCRPRRGPSPGRCGSPGRAGTRSSTPRRCRRPASTITWCTVWPLMSMPRIAAACSAASSGVVGQLDAAGLAAAADLHLRLDDDRAAPSRSAAARASSGGGRRPSPASTGTPCAANSSCAWYSYRSTRRLTSPDSLP